MKTAGYVVIEFCDDFEKILAVDRDAKYPKGGVLQWTKGAKSMFPSRVEARAAINRTEHYRLAFGVNLPERKLCRVEAVKMADEVAG